MKKKSTIKEGVSTGSDPIDTGSRVGKFLKKKGKMTAHDVKRADRIKSKVGNKFYKKYKGSRKSGEREFDMAKKTHIEESIYTHLKQLLIEGSLGFRRGQRLFKAADKAHNKFYGKTDYNNNSADYLDKLSKAGKKYNLSTTQNTKALAKRKFKKGIK